MALPFYKDYNREASDLLTKGFPARENFLIHGEISVPARVNQPFGVLSTLKLARDDKKAQKISHGLELRCNHIKELGAVFAFNNDELKTTLTHKPVSQRFGTGWTNILEVTSPLAAMDPKNFVGKLESKLIHQYGTAALSMSGPFNNTGEKILSTSALFGNAAAVVGGEVEYSLSNSNLNAANVLAGYAKSGCTLSLYLNNRWAKKSSDLAPSNVVSTPGVLLISAIPRDWFKTPTKVAVKGEYNLEKHRPDLAVAVSLSPPDLPFSNFRFKFDSNKTLAAQITCGSPQVQLPPPPSVVTNRAQSNPVYFRNKLGLTPKITFFFFFFFFL
jgi:hypothetical protein